VISAVQAVRGVEVVEITDRTFQVHRRGKIHTGLNMPVKSRDDLSMAYTPGVARVCSAISENRQKAFKYTIKANTVAVVSDGTAVLGLGDIGPEAAMPVMEGKAMLFKEFADVDAFPICLSTKGVDEIVETVVRIAPTFGGINLEDISSPRCFEIEQRLQRELDIPVFHDDQHGTAIVTLAALINACRLTGRRIEDLEVLLVGAGAAGVAVVKILIDAGVTSIVACDRFGAIHAGREDYEAGSMNAPKRWLAEHTNPDRRDGSPRSVIEGTDLFIGLSGPGIIEASDLERMNADPFVFAMANPNPEVPPEQAARYVRVMATGRSDYPNQINNVLAFPGVFRGALDARASAITEEMKLAAARGIAGTIADDELDEDYIIPSVFNRDVSRAVASAVADVAAREGGAEPEQPTVERAAIGS
jgi:malate dehydrogenase (oxaloacetate-decarboxylating)